MSKKIIVDFYRLEFTNGNSTFEALLSQIIALQPEERTNDVRYTPIHLHRAKKSGDFWEGEIIRIRMVDPPVKASRAGDVVDIPLDDDEGIGERTAFLYHCPTRVLLIQNTHSGVSISTFLRYFQAMSGGIPIMADPILQPEAMEKLQRMKEIQKFELRVAGLDNPGKLLQGEDLAIGAFQKIAEEFNAPTLSLALSVGHKKRSLDFETVLNTVRDLVRGNEEQVEGKGQKIGLLRITGSASQTEEDEETTKLVVDLLRDRVREQINSTVKGRVSIPYFARIQALETAWRRRSEEILKMFDAI